MNDNSTKQGRINLRAKIRFFWHNWLRNIKILQPLINAIAVTDFFALVVDFIDTRVCHISYQETSNYFKQNKNRIKKIMSKLSDDKSREVYKNIIKYRSTHNRKYLKGIVDKDQYFEKDIIKLGDDEIFVDCGAYDGDTARTFLDNLPNKNKFKEIVVLEPEPNNYKRLVNWLSSLYDDVGDCLKTKDGVQNMSCCTGASDENHVKVDKNSTESSEVMDKVEIDSHSKASLRQYVGGGNGRIKCLNVGTWDKEATLSFKANDWGASALNENGNTTVKVDALDNILSDKAVTFIKMDVEGAELASLKGAQKVISSNLPTLAICIYHSDTDMIDIPEYIMGKYPSYSLYIRHYSYRFNETVLYAVSNKYFPT